MATLQSLGPARLRGIADLTPAQSRPQQHLRSTLSVSAPENGSRTCKRTSCSRVSSLVSSTIFGVGSSSLRQPPAQLARAKRRVVKVEARRGGGDTVGAAERVLAAAGYLLPLLDGVRYGRYLFLQYPSTRILLEPLSPVIRAYSSFPYAAIIAFFALYIGVIQNQSFSRFVRYNCMQAVILDILMILPSLFERLIGANGGIGQDIVILIYNTVFIYLFACFVFGVGSCLLGKAPRLPLVADAAEAQVPF